MLKSRGIKLLKGQITNNNAKKQTKNLIGGLLGVVYLIISYFGVYV